MSFDATLTLNVVLPLAVAAYDSRKLPQGWIIRAEIQPGNFGYIVEGAVVRSSVLRRVVAICWLEDFDTFVVDAQFGGPGHVHQGFQRQYSTIRQSILNGLAGVTWDELWIIGHSLGGALALLCAGELSHHEPMVWTFEGPRTGWFDWAHWFDQVITVCWRIVNHWDIVPHVPNELVGFRHVGSEITIYAPASTDMHVNHSLISDAAGLQKLITAPP